MVQWRNLETGRAMFAPKIHVSTNIVQSSFLAAILCNTSSILYNFPINGSQFQHFSRQSLPVLCAHGVRPIGGSGTGARVSDVSCRFSYASELFDAMSRRETDLARSLDAFKLLRCVSEVPNLASATMVHALAVKQGALSDLHTATLLLTVYSTSKELDSSVAFFDEVLYRDVVFWNAMMSAFVENKCFRSAIGCFVKMVGEGNEFDSTTLVVTVSAVSGLKMVRQGGVVHGLGVKAGMLSDTILSNAVIDMYAKGGDLRSSECVFAGVKCKDIVSWNSILSGCFYNNQPEKSLWYFKHMASCENKADSTSISCAIAACVRLREFDVGLAIHGFGIKLGYAETSHVSVSNSLIYFYFRCRDIYAAECVFERMIVKNVVSWNAMIKGLFVNGEAAAAFELLHDMQFLASIQPDLATLLTVIPFCADLLLLLEGKAAHGFAIRRDMASELSVINSIINLYSKCYKVKEAEYLFSMMPRTDLIAWNTMIFGYSHNGQSQESQKLFKKMLGCNLAFTLPTLFAILASCESPDSLQFGRSIHSWSIKVGFSNNNFSLNSLIDMYISCGLPSDAFTLFGQFSAQADITSWNTIIAGCIRQGHFWAALEYYDKMRKASKLHINSIILVSVTSACGNLGLACQGQLIHGFALKTGSVYDMQVQNSLVIMYGRLGDTESARLAWNLGYDLDLCSWDSLTSSMPQNEDAKKALELFRSLEFEPDEITICMILSACTQLGTMTHGKQIHGHAFRFGFHQKPSTSAALVDMYSTCGRLDVAEKVFLCSPDKSGAAWNSLISAYGFHNMGSEAIETFQGMTKSAGIAPTNSTFTSLLSACSHSGMVDEGRQYYDQMFHKYKVQHTAEHHACMANMLAQAGKLHEAYDFIKGLQTEPEPAIWAALLSACRYNGDLEMGKKVAEILFAMEPENVSYYVVLCNMHVAAGRWEEAVELRALIQHKQQQLEKQVDYNFSDTTGLR